MGGLLLYDAAAETLAVQASEAMQSTMSLCV